MDAFGFIALPNMRHSFSCGTRCTRVDNQEGDGHSEHQGLWCLFARKPNGALVNYHRVVHTARRPMVEFFDFVYKRIKLFIREHVASRNSQFAHEGGCNCRTASQSTTDWDGRADVEDQVRNGYM